MRDTKLYIVISQMNIIELNRFAKFVHSPYFNNNEQLVKLFQILNEDLRNSNGKPLKKSDVWAQIVPGEPFEDVKFRKLLSDLLKLLERFLAQEMYDDNPLHRANYLLQAIHDKRLEKLYNTSMKSARRLAGRQMDQSSSYYFHIYNLERNFYNILELEASRDKKKIIEAINIEDIGNNLDRFYLAEKMKYYCSLLSWEKYIFKQQSKYLFTDEIISHIRDNYDMYEKIPSVSIYYQIYLTLVDSDNEAHFSKYKTLVNKYIQYFNRPEANDIVYAGLNYCTDNINKGKQVYLQEFLELINNALAQDLLLENEEISPWLFRNAIVFALRLRKFRWAENFISDYQDKLNDKHRKQTVSFNLATLYFYQKKYNEVIELLQEVEYENLTYNLNAKTILMMTFYELDESEPLTSLINSFKAYLNRIKNLIPESRLKLYTNFTRFMNRILNLNYYDKDAVKSLKLQIEKANPIASKPWLLEKIHELE